jgi:hypothetical protein
VVEPFPAPLASLAGKKVFLGPATLRPETMYESTIHTHTNAWQMAFRPLHWACRVENRWLM